MRHAFHILLLLVCCSPNLLADDNWKDTFQLANEAYKQDNPAKAQALYEAILANNKESEILYYNLGNAYFKTGNLAGAIWSFEKALLLNPANKDAEHNLALANAKLQDAVEPLPEFFFSRFIRQLTTYLSPKYWTWMSVLTAWLCCIGFIMYFMAKTKPKRKSGFFIGLTSLVFAVLLGTIAWLGFKEVANPNAAIVFSPNVYVKSAPTEGGNDIFMIHHGLKVETLEQSDNWVRIKLADGKIGWLKEDDIKPL